MRYRFTRIAATISSRGSNMLRVDDPPLLLAAAAAVLLDGAESPPCAGQESDRRQAGRRSGCVWV